MYVASALSLLLCVAVSASTHSEDGYLTSSRARCLGSGGLLNCGKYQLARLLHRVAATPRSFDMGPLRLVSLPQGNTSDESALLPREAAPQAHMPEYMRMLQFGVRQAELFLNSHGLSLPLSTGSGSSGARLMYDDGAGPTTFTDRGIHSKKKMQLFLPMMLMLKFGVIKALLIPILLGVLFIKKVIVLGVMVLPSILSMLKACKITTPYHHTPYHSEGFSAAGGDYAAYANQADSYTKDWAGANQRRTRYGKSSLAYDEAEYSITEHP